MCHESQASALLLNYAICYTVVSESAEKPKNKLIFSSIIKLLHPLYNSELPNVRWEGF